MACVSRIAVLAFVLLIFSAAASAAPSLFDAKPSNDSFTGKGAVNFSVNITDPSLDSNSARLFVISENAYQQSEPWDNFTMQCSSYAANNWTCIRSVSFAIAGSDTLELFYFTANDTSGSVGHLGNSTHPLEFVIDRNPPSIAFAAPVNGTYISGIITVSAVISDSVSGVNASRVEFSSNGTTWTAMNLTGSIFTASFNTMPYSDNSTAKLFVRASDIVNNTANASVTVYIENELPQITVISPQAGLLSGVTTFSANATDGISGIKPNGVTYSIAGNVSAMQCSGPACTSLVNTSAYADGAYTITFSATDRAENARNATLNVTIKNSATAVQIVSNEHLKSMAKINATISNSQGVVSAVSLRVSGASSLEVAMSCNPAFTECGYSLDTSQFSDGPYTITVTASGTGTNWTASKNIVIDNTQPAVAIKSDAIIKGTATIRADVTDANHNASAVTMAIESSAPMSCTQSGALLDCFAQYDTLPLTDGPKEIKITAIDKAGNSFAATKIVSIDNKPPEFVFLKIVPSYSESAVDVSFTAGVKDTGSNLSNVTLAIKNANFNSYLELEYVSSVWFGKATIATKGGNNIDIIASDAGGNTATFENVGYLYIGTLSCGDGICQAEENACLCASDCKPPVCSGDETIECGSGLPICAPKPECGDGICSLSETCATCGMDCGVCDALERVSVKRIGIPVGPIVLLDLQSFADFIEQNPFVIALIIIVIVVAVAILIKHVRRPKYVKMWELYGSEKK